MLLLVLSHILLVFSLALEMESSVPLSGSPKKKARLSKRELRYRQRMDFQSERDQQTELQSEDRLKAIQSGDQSEGQLLRLDQLTEPPSGDRSEAQLSPEKEPQSRDRSGALSEDQLMELLSGEDQVTVHLSLLMANQSLDRMMEIPSEDLRKAILSALQEKGVQLQEIQKTALRLNRLAGVLTLPLIEKELQSVQLPELAAELSLQLAHLLAGQSTLQELVNLSPLALDWLEHLFAQEKFRLLTEPESLLELGHSEIQSVRECLQQLERESPLVPGTGYRSLAEELSLQPSDFLLGPPPPESDSRSPPQKEQRLRRRKVEWTEPLMVEEKAPETADWTGSGKAPEMVEETAEQRVLGRAGSKALGRVLGKAEPKGPEMAGLKAVRLDLMSLAMLSAVKMTGSLWAFPMAWMLSGCLLGFLSGSRLEKLLVRMSLGILLATLLAQTMTALETVDWKAWLWLGMMLVVTFPANLKELWRVIELWGAPSSGF